MRAVATNSAFAKKVGIPQSVGREFINADNKKVKKMASKKKNWIQEAIEKPGSLRKELGVKKGEKIPKKKLAAAAKKGGKLGQRARLAETLSKMRKKKKK